MPSGKNWVNFLYVNIAFAIYIAGVFYYSQMAEIKANWPLYRCNPMYMFLADDVEQNFTYCIQTMQTNFMGYLLAPLTYITGTLGSQLGGFMNDIQNIRAMFNKVRTFFTSIIQSVFGVFLNLIIEFQRITISIKDLIGKTIGIMVSLMYVMDGSVKTMNSTWNGPPGQLVRALGKCFHPFTKLKLKNGTIKCMKDIDLGDILEDGSVVESVLKIDNKKNQNHFYEIPNGVNGENISVTGSHLVLDKNSNKFIKVEDYKSARVTNIKYDWFSCLITDTHKIPIGKEIFWDWEDHFVKI
jgi:hypothetical protein